MYILINSTDASGGDLSNFPSIINLIQNPNLHIQTYPKFLNLESKKYCCNYSEFGFLFTRNKETTTPMLYYLSQSTYKDHPMAESEEELKSLVMKVEKESGKVGLKLNIQKTKIMASGPITSWEIDGETVETMAEFIFGVSKITTDGDCSHEIKRRLLLGRKVMTNLDSILKSRDITVPSKVPLVQAMVFPVVMYGCEGWTIKKAERQRIDDFELWCWRDS